MPGMDGIELLRNARSNEMISRFVMLNCMNEFKYAQQALEYGASGYILKLSMSMQSMQDILAKVAKELTVANEQRQQVLSQKFNVFYKQIHDRIKADRLEEEALKQNMIEAKLGMWTGSYTSSSVTSLFFWFPSEPALDLEKLRLSCRGKADLYKQQ
ncbi:hypothetical protein NZ043_26100 [Paenibacillus sp. FSL k6-2145]|uniref:hypothetical protein n=2 Tax=Paenibacillus TaxID=44249 RepID=UPI002678C997